MTTSTSTPVRGERLRSLFVGRDQYVARLSLLLFALVLFFLVVKTQAFLRPNTWIAMGVTFPEFGIMALGVMLTMITGGIDLSVVGIANMTSIVAALTMVAMVPGDGSVPPTVFLLAVGASLALGALAGLVNGFLVAVVRIPAILVTLGTLELYTGIAIVLTSGRPISGLPIEYSNTVAARLGGVLPMQLVIFAVLAVAIGIVLHRTGFGTQLYMLGTNPTAAKFSGLGSVSLLLRTYMLSGLCASVAGLVMLANYNSAKADYGVSYTLLTILIVVLGGVNPNGGSGKIGGVVVAIIILQVLSSGLNLFPEVSNFYRPLIWGGVLLLVISTSERTGAGVLKRFRSRKKGAGHETRQEQAGSRRG